MENIDNGKLIINEFGNGFVNLIEPNITIYIPKKNLHFAYHNQTVDIKYFYNNNMYYGEVINYSLVNQTFIGKITHFFKNYIYIKTFQLKNNLIAIQSNVSLQKNDWIKCIVTNVDFDNTQIYGDFLEKIDYNNNIDILIEKVFNLNDIDVNIDIDINNNNLESYIDLTHLDTFTIDPKNSLDCDDAFSIEKIDNIYKIYVHISDVSLYINPKNPSFNKIINRGNTIYGKNKNWSMIPSNFSNNICSILPEKTTYVITHLFIYNPEINELLFETFFPSYVISKNKYDYEYVDNNMNNDIFTTLYNSSLLIKNKIFDFDVNDDSKSHSMIKYWMIHLNVIMAEHLQKIYRYNPIPSKNKFEIFNDYSFYLYGKYIDYNNRNNIIKLINKHPTQLTFYIIKVLLTKAYYSIKKDNENHYGLGLQEYTHWTSPIRRACDLLNHCLIKGYDIDISKYINIMNEQELLQDNIELFINEYNLYNNIEIGNIYESIILHMSQTGIIIYIPELDNKYTIHISKLSNKKLIYNTEKKTLENENNIIYTLFQKINVYISKITHSDIHFSLK